MYYKVSTTEGYKFIATTSDSGFSFVGSGLSLNPDLLMWNPSSNPIAYTIIRNIGFYIISGTPVQNVIYVAIGYQANEPSGGADLPHVLSYDGSSNFTVCKQGASVENIPSLVRPIFGMDSSGLYKMQRGEDEPYILKPGYFFSLHVINPMPNLNFICSVSFEESEVAS